jgi:hypothetical protein
MLSYSTAKQWSARVAVESAGAGTSGPDSGLEWLRTALHDLAQPLTTLECLLFLGKLDADQDASKLGQTVDEAMVQCQRMLVCFRAIQEQLSTANDKTGTGTVQQ